MENSRSGYYDREYMAEFYDPVYEQLRSKDKDFYIDYARLAKGKILELGCGTGRVLVPIALFGFEVTGVDLSPYMLAKCREKLDNQPLAVKQRAKIIQGDMCNFNTGEHIPWSLCRSEPFSILCSLGN
jgi:SAM-dependent methyltransferase